MKRFRNEKALGEHWILRTQRDCEECNDFYLGHEKVTGRVSLLLRAILASLYFHGQTAARVSHIRADIAVLIENLL